MENEYATSKVVAQCELTERQWTKLQQVHDGNTTKPAGFSKETIAPTLISSYRSLCQAPLPNLPWKKQMEHCAVAIF